MYQPAWQPVNAENPGMPTVGSDILTRPRSCKGVGRPDEKRRAACVRLEGGAPPSWRLSPASCRRLLGSMAWFVKAASAPAEDSARCRIQPPRWRRPPQGKRQHHRLRRVANLPMTTCPGTVFARGWGGPDEKRRAACVRLEGGAPPSWRLSPASCRRLFGSMAWFVKAASAPAEDSARCRIQPPRWRRSPQEKRQHHRFRRVANLAMTTCPDIALRLKFKPIGSSAFPAGQDA